MEIEIAARLQAQIDEEKYKIQEKLREQYEAVHGIFGAKLGNASG
jgi:hypothetical protein